MKKLVILILFGFAATQVKAQQPIWQIRSILGFDMGAAIPLPLSAAPKGAKASPKLMLTPGVGLQRNFNERWDLGIELNYHILSIDASVDVISQAFWSDDRSFATYFSGEAFTSTELKFIEIPISASYKISKRMSLVLGAYYSQIIKGVFETEGKNGWISADKEDTDTTPLPGTQNTRFNFNDELDNYDFGALIGYKLKIGERLNIRGRINLGLKSIFRPDFTNIDYEMYQVRFGAGVSYAIWTK